MTTQHNEYRATNGPRPIFFAPQFIFLAKSLKDADPGRDTDMFGHEVWKKIILTMAHDLETNNARFNRKRFLTDCGLPPPNTRR